jgi:hypothetical protein
MSLGSVPDNAVSRRYLPRPQVSPEGNSEEEGRAGAHKTLSRVRLPMSFGSVPDSPVSDRCLPRPRVSPGGNGEGRPRGGAQVSQLRQVGHRRLQLVAR